VAAGTGPQDPPPKTLGLHRIMFAVDDIGDTVARLRAHGAELFGEAAGYESIFLLCHLRGPASIIVALAELGGRPLPGRSAASCLDVAVLDDLGCSAGDSQCTEAQELPGGRQPPARIGAGQEFAGRERDRGAR
jgi:hypothetical protein